MGRILVAEDDENMRAMIGSVIRQTGHQVEFAANGLEAIDRLGATGYDAIILDLMMPAASGFEVLAWMHRKQRGAAQRQVIVLTAMAEQSLTNLTKDRVFAVIRKPFDIDNLRDTVTRCVAAAAR